MGKIPQVRKPPADGVAHCKHASTDSRGEWFEWSFAASGRFALALLAMIFCLAVALPPALASEAAATKLPQPLTQESIRELVSRLDDAEVRRLLIDQLDRAAAPAVPKKADEMGGMEQAASMEFERARERAAALVASIADVPAVLGQVAVRMAEPRPPSDLWIAVGGILLMLVFGAVVEFAFRKLTRGASRRFEDRPAEGLAGSTVRVALRVGIGLANLVVFTVGALALFFALWQGHEQARFLILATLSAVVQVRVFALLARVLLEPKAPHLRLLPFDDRAARVLYWGAVRLAVLFGLLRLALIFLLHFGAPPEPIVLIFIPGGALFIVLMLDTIWKVRADVAGLIRGPGEPGPLRRLLADLWPALAAVYLLGVYLSRLYALLLGKTQSNNAAILSLALLLMLPLADMLLCRILAAVMRQPAAADEADKPASVAESFEPVLRRAIHIIVLVAGFLILAGLWEVDLFAMAERSMGGRVASALLGIAITTLLAWILWEVARTAIDRRMAAEAFSTGHNAPASRLRTLLPLLRITLQITILVMAVLSIMAALGINIIPLLAGASVVGVAIGFGSQSLVRDIVSGAFFLMDDAFRLGEYIEVGNDKGVVEKIGVRSVVLRHHRGPLNVLPYGEIRRLRNTSRDWMIMKMEFRLAFDTDLKKVKQIFRKIGEELAADPELGPDIIETLKSQGVGETNESGLLVRAKFMARPEGGQAFTIQREAYSMIIRAFAEAGIKFAQQRVTVSVDPGTPLDAAGAAAATGAGAS